MNARQTIELAKKHWGKGGMSSSAQLCLVEAVSLYDDGNFVSARERALKSLAYSVGILHPDYKRASK